MELSLPLPRRTPRRRTASGTRVGDAVRGLARNRLLLRVTLCALLSIALLTGGWMWLRNSSLVSVRHIHITGVHGADAREIRTALDDAAARMTTLDFNEGALRSAVASFTVIGGLHVSTSFPHSVSIAVTERPPVAALLSAGQRTAVAADGAVLGPALLSSSLPTISGSVEPSPGAHLSEAATLAAVAVLGATPTPLMRFVARVFNGREGLTVAMRNGLLVYFGDSTRPHAKWLSLARVLSSPSAAGARYVDVRLPERPAAGFSLASTSSTSTSSTLTPVGSGASDPTAAALAASLSSAVGGSAEPAASSSTGSAETSSPSGESETSSGSSGEASSAASEASSGSEASTASPSGTSSEASSAATEEQAPAPASGG
jgi:cell division protein FtsQ